MRSLQFTGIRDKFLAIKGSGTAHKKVRLAYYLVPTFIFTGMALSNFLHVSFGIYLKYQALVDSYHQHKVDQRFGKMAETDDDS